MIPELIFENHRVIEDKYFRADETFPGVYKISQPWFREDSLHVYCFLIVGSKAAIVYDSMFGYGNLRAFCEKITDKPLLMVNSHFHPPLRSARHLSGLRQNPGRAAAARHRDRQAGIRQSTAAGGYV